MVATGTYLAMLNMYWDVLINYFQDLYHSKYLATFLGAVATIFVVIRTFADWHGWIPISYGVFLLFGITILSRNHHYHKKLSSITKNLVDLEKASILDVSVADLCLLLRPFHYDKELRKADSSFLAMFFSGIGYALIDRLQYGPTMEARLHDSINDKLGLFLIGLENPNSNVLLQQGMGRFSVENDWQKAVKETLQKANLILMVPDDSPSCMFEIDTIVGSQSLLRKTVFVVPFSNKTNESVSRQLKQKKIISEILGIDITDCHAKGILIRKIFNTVHLY